MLAGYERIQKKEKKKTFFTKLKSISKQYDKYIMKSVEWEEERIVHRIKKEGKIECMHKQCIQIWIKLWDKDSTFMLFEAEAIGI